MKMAIFLVSHLKMRYDIVKGKILSGRVVNVFVYEKLLQTPNICMTKTCLAARVRIIKGR